RTDGGAGGDLEDRARAREPPSSPPVLQPTRPQEHHLPHPHPQVPVVSRGAAKALAFLAEPCSQTPTLLHGQPPSLVPKRLTPRLQAVHRESTRGLLRAPRGAARALVFLEEPCSPTPTNTQPPLTGPLPPPPPGPPPPGSTHISEVEASLRPNPSPTRYRHPNHPSRRTAPTRPPNRLPSPHHPPQAARTHPQGLAPQAHGSGGTRVEGPTGEATTEPTQISLPPPFVPRSNLHTGPAPRPPPPTPSPGRVPHEWPRWAAITPHTQLARSVPTEGDVSRRVGMHTEHPLPGEPPILPPPTPLAPQPPLPSQTGADNQVGRRRKNRGRGGRGSAHVLPPPSLPHQEPLPTSHPVEQLPGPTSTARPPNLHSRPAPAPPQGHGSGPAHSPPFCPSRAVSPSQVAAAAIATGRGAVGLRDAPMADATDSPSHPSHPFHVDDPLPQPMVIGEGQGGLLGQGPHPSSAQPARPTPPSTLPALLLSPTGRQVFETPEEVRAGISDLLAIHRLSSSPAAPTLPVPQDRTRTYAEVTRSVPSFIPPATQPGASLPTPMETDRGLRPCHSHLDGVAPPPVQPVAQEVTSSRDEAIRPYRDPSAWASSDATAPIDPADTATSPDQVVSCPTCRSSLANRRALQHHIPFCHPADAARRAQAAHDTASIIPSLSQPRATGMQFTDAQWQTLDSVDWTEYFSPERIHTRPLRRVPERVRGGYLDVLSAILVRIAQDPEAAGPTFLLAAAPTLFLVPATPPDRSHTAAIATRISRFGRGEWAELVSDALGRRTPLPRRTGHRSRTATDPSAADERRIARCLRLAACNETSRACAALESAEAAPDTQGTIQRLQSKHPNAERPTPAWLSGFQGSPLVLSVDHLRRAIFTAPRGSSGGPSGWVAEHLRDTFLAFPQSLHFLLAVYQQWLRGRCAPAARSLLASSTLVALAKSNMDVRPIAIGEVLVRILSRAVCLQLRDQMARVFLASQQFGVGVTCGTEVVVRGVRRALADHPDWVVLQLDVANAFNSFHRDRMFQALQASPEFQCLIPFIGLFYGTPSDLHYRSGTGVVTMHSERGTRQGDPLSPFLYALTQRLALEPVLAEGDVQLWSYADDTYVLGPPDRVLHHFAEIVRRLGEMGLAAQPHKCLVYQTESFLSRDLEAFTGLGIEVARRGLTVTGVPVGTVSFVEQSLPDRLERMGRVLPWLPRLRQPQTAARLLSACVSTRPQYLSRTVPPSPAVISSFTRWDARLGETFQQLLASGTWACREDVREAALDQIFLPIRLGGFGIRRMARIAPVSFVCSWVQCAPILCSLPACGEVFRQSFASGEPEQIDRALQTALEGLPPDVLSLLPPWPSCASASPDSLFAGASRLLEAHALEAVRARHTSPLHLARLTSLQGGGAGAWLTSVPYADPLRIPEALWQAASSSRLGLPIPQLALAGQCSCGQAIDDMTVPHHAVRCPRYGVATTIHDTVKYMLRDFAVEAGFAVKVEDSTLFTQLEAARARLLGQPVVGEGTRAEGPGERRGEAGQPGGGGQWGRHQLRGQVERGTGGQRGRQGEQTGQDGEGGRHRQQQESQWRPRAQGAAPPGSASGAGQGREQQRADGGTGGAAGLGGEGQGVREAAGDGAGGSGGLGEGREGEGRGQVDGGEERGRETIGEGAPRDQTGQQPAQQQGPVGRTGRVGTASRIPDLTCRDVGQGLMVLVDVSIADPQREGNVQLRRATPTQIGVAAARRVQEKLRHWGPHLEGLQPAPHFYACVAETFGLLSEPLRQFLGLCAKRIAQRRRDRGGGDDGSARIFEAGLTTRLSVALQRAQAQCMIQHAVRQLGSHTPCPLMPSAPPAPTLRVPAPLPPLLTLPAPPRRFPPPAIRSSPPVRSPPLPSPPPSPPLLHASSFPSPTHSTPCPSSIRTLPLVSRPPMLGFSPPCPSPPFPAPHLPPLPAPPTLPPPLVLGFLPPCLTFPPSVCSASPLPAPPSSPPCPSFSAPPPPHARFLPSPRLPFFLRASPLLPPCPRLPMPLSLASPLPAPRFFPPCPPSAPPLFSPHPLLLSSLPLISHTPALVSYHPCPSFPPFPLPVAAPPLAPSTPLPPVHPKSHPTAPTLPRLPVSALHPRDRVRLPTAQRCHTPCPLMPSAPPAPTLRVPAPLPPLLTLPAPPRRFPPPAIRSSPPVRSPPLPSPPPSPPLLHASSFPSPTHSTPCPSSIRTLPLVSRPPMLGFSPPCPSPPFPAPHLPPLPAPPTLPPPLSLASYLPASPFPLRVLSFSPPCPSLLPALPLIFRPPPPHARFLPSPRLPFFLRASPLLPPCPRLPMPLSLASPLPAPRFFPPCPPSAPPLFSPHPLLLSSLPLISHTPALVSYHPCPSFPPFVRSASSLPAPPFLPPCPLLSPRYAPFSPSLLPSYHPKQAILPRPAPAPYPSIPPPRSLSCVSSLATFIPPPPSPPPRLLPIITRMFPHSPVHNVPPPPFLLSPLPLCPPHLYEPYFPLQPPFPPQLLPHPAWAAPLHPALPGPSVTQLPPPGTTPPFPPPSNLYTPCPCSLRNPATYPSLPLPLPNSTPPFLPPAKVYTPCFCSLGCAVPNLPPPFRGTRPPLPPPANLCTPCSCPLCPPTPYLNPPQSPPSPTPSIFPPPWGSPIRSYHPSSIPQFPLSPVSRPRILFLHLPQHLLSVPSLPSHVLTPRLPTFSLPATRLTPTRLPTTLCPFLSVPHPSFPTWLHLPTPTSRGILPCPPHLWPTTCPHTLLTHRYTTPAPPPPLQPANTSPLNRPPARPPLGPQSPPTCQAPSTLSSTHCAPLSPPFSPFPKLTPRTPASAREARGELAADTAREGVSEFVCEGAAEATEDGAAKAAREGAMGVVGEGAAEAAEERAAEAAREGAAAAARERAAGAAREGAAGTVTLARQRAEAMETGFAGVGATEPAAVSAGGTAAEEAIGTAPVEAARTAAGATEATAGAGIGGGATGAAGKGVTGTGARESAAPAVAREGTAGASKAEGEAAAEAAGRAIARPVGAAGAAANSGKHTAGPAGPAETAKGASSKAAAGGVGLGDIGATGEGEGRVVPTGVGTEEGDVIAIEEDEGEDVMHIDGPLAQYLTLDGEADPAPLQPHVEVPPLPPMPVPMLAEGPMEGLGETLRTEPREGAPILTSRPPAHQPPGAPLPHPHPQVPVVSRGAAKALAFLAEPCSPTPTLLHGQPPSPSPTPDPTVAGGPPGEHAAHLCPHPQGLLRAPRGAARALVFLEEPCSPTPTNTQPPPYRPTTPSSTRPPPTRRRTAPTRPPNRLPSPHHPPQAAETHPQGLAPQAHGSGGTRVEGPTGEATTEPTQISLPPPFVPRSNLHTGPAPRPPPPTPSPGRVPHEWPRWAAITPHTQLARSVPTEGDVSRRVGMHTEHPPAWRTTHPPSTHPFGPTAPPSFTNRRGQPGWPPAEEQGQRRQRVSPPRPPNLHSRPAPAPPQGHGSGPAHSPPFCPSRAVSPSQVAAAAIATGRGAVGLRDAPMADATDSPSHPSHPFHVDDPLPQPMVIGEGQGGLLGQGPHPSSAQPARPTPPSTLPALLLSPTGRQVFETPEEVRAGISDLLAIHRLSSSPAAPTLPVPQDRTRTYAEVTRSVPSFIPPATQPGASLPTPMETDRGLRPCHSHLDGVAPPPVQPVAQEVTSSRDEASAPTETPPPGVAEPSLEPHPAEGQEHTTAHTSGSPPRPPSPASTPVPARGPALSCATPPLSSLTPPPRGAGESSPPLIPGDPVGAQAAHGVPSTASSDATAPIDPADTATSPDQVVSCPTCRSSLANRRALQHHIPFCHPADAARRAQAAHDTASIIPSLSQPRATGMQFTDAQWQTLDSVDWTEYFSPERIHTRPLRRVPERVRGGYLDVLSAILVRIAQDPEAAGPTFLLAAAPTLFLVPATPPDRSHTAAIATRISRFGRGEWAELVSDALGRRTPLPRRTGHRSRTATDPSAADERRIARCLRLAACNETSRACAALESAEAAPDTQGTIQRLQSKHPNAERPTPAWLSGFQGSPLVLSVDHLRRAIFTAPRGSSGGPSGWVAEHLRDTFLAFPQSLHFLLAVYQQWLRGRCAPAARSLLASSTLVALAKSNMDVRPIAIGEVLVRILSRAVCLQLRDQMARVFLASQQFGVGVTCGTEVVVRGVRRALADHPDWVVLQLDVANAFNSFHRDRMFQALQASPEFQCLIPFIGLFYGTPSDLHYRSGTGVVTMHSERGTRQGDPLSPFLYALTQRLALEPVLAEGDVQLWSYADDTYVLGPPDRVLHHFAEIVRRLGEMGLAAQPHKCLVYQTESFLSRDLEAFTGLGIEVARRGLTVTGVPVGTVSFVEQSLPDRLERMGRVLPWLPRLRQPQTAARLLSACVSTRPQYLSRTVPPSPAVISSFTRWDARLGETFQQLLASGTWACREDVREAALDQIFLPIRLGGFGIRRMARMAPVSFVCSWVQCAPILCSLPACGEVFRQSFASGEPEQIDRALQTALEGLPPDVLSLLPPWPSCASASPDSLFAGASRLLEAHALEAVRARHTSPLHLARLTSLQGGGAGAWLTSVPYADPLRIPEALWQAASSSRLGLPIPQLALAGQCSCGQAIDDMTVPHHAVRCPRYGVATTIHDTVKYMLRDFAVEAGFAVKVEDSTLFTQLEAARARLLGQPVVGEGTRAEGPGERRGEAGQPGGGGQWGRHQLRGQVERGTGGQRGRQGEQTGQDGEGGRHRQQQESQWRPRAQGAAPPGSASGAGQGREQQRADGGTGGAAGLGGEGQGVREAAGDGAGGSGGLGEGREGEGRGQVDGGEERGRETIGEGAPRDQTGQQPAQQQGPVGRTGRVGTASRIPDLTCRDVGQGLMVLVDVSIADPQREGNVQLRRATPTQIGVAAARRVQEKLRHWGPHLEGLQPAPHFYACVAETFGLLSEPLRQFLGLCAKRIAQRRRDRGGGDDGSARIFEAGLTTRLSVALQRAQAQCMIQHAVRQLGSHTPCPLMPSAPPAPTLRVPAPLPPLLTLPAPPRRFPPPAIRSSPPVRSPPLPSPPPSPPLLHASSFPSPTHSTPCPSSIRTLPLVSRPPMLGFSPPCPSPPFPAPHLPPLPAPPTLPPPLSLASYLPASPFPPPCAQLLPSLPLPPPRPAPHFPPPPPHARFLPSPRLPFFLRASPLLPPCPRLPMPLSLASPLPAPRFFPPCPPSAPPLFSPHPLLLSSLPLISHTPALVSYHPCPSFPPFPLPVAAPPLAPSTPLPPVHPKSHPTAPTLPRLPVSALHPRDRVRLPTAQRCHTPCPLMPSAPPAPTLRVPAPLPPLLTLPAPPRRFPPPAIRSSPPVRSPPLPSPPPSPPLLHASSFPSPTHSTPCPSSIRTLPLVSRPPMLGFSPPCPSPPFPAPHLPPLPAPPTLPPPCPWLPTSLPHLSPLRVLSFSPPCPSLLPALPLIFRPPPPHARFLPSPRLPFFLRASPLLPPCPRLPMPLSLASPLPAPRFFPPCPPSAPPLFSPHPLLLSSLPLISHTPALVSYHPCPSFPPFPLPVAAPPLAPSTPLPPVHPKSHPTAPTLPRLPVSALHPRDRVRLPTAQRWCARGHYRPSPLIPHHAPKQAFLPPASRLPALSTAALCPCVTLAHFIPPPPSPPPPGFSLSSPACSPTPLSTTSLHPPSCFPHSHSAPHTSTSRTSPSSLPFPPSYFRIQPTYPSLPLPLPNSTPPFLPPAKVYTPCFCSLGCAVPNLPPPFRGTRPPLPPPANFCTPCSCPLCPPTPYLNPPQSPPSPTPSIFPPPWGSPIRSYHPSSIPQFPLSPVSRPRILSCIYHSTSFRCPLCPPTFSPPASQPSHYPLPGSRQLDYPLPFAPSSLFPTLPFPPGSTCPPPPPVEFCPALPTSGPPPVPTPCSPTATPPPPPHLHYSPPTLPLSIGPQPAPPLGPNPLQLSGPLYPLFHPLRTAFPTLFPFPQANPPHPGLCQGVPSPFDALLSQPQQLTPPPPGMLPLARGELAADTAREGVSEFVCEGAAEATEDGAAKAAREGAMGVVGEGAAEAAEERAAEAAREGAAAAARERAAGAAREGAAGTVTLARQRAEAMET
ncbi:unnamed protein product, partial [Closterium sp. NIES-65]